MAKDKSGIRIIRKIRRIEFWYNDEFFTYELRSEGKEEASFIWKDGARIYGPLMHHSTEEGREVFNLIEKKLGTSKSKI
jgi:hypothetical protein